jgi:hypothetical protein
MNTKSFLLFTLFSILLFFGAAGTSPAARNQTDRSRLQIGATTQHPGTFRGRGAPDPATLQRSGPFRHVDMAIGGRITGSSAIRDRRIKIILRHGARTLFSQIKTLDANGSCTYRFRVMGPGRYTVRVEKVPSGSEMYSRSNVYNVCFDGTRPGTRTVTLSGTTPQSLHNDFTIAYTILWNEHDLCW